MTVTKPIDRIKSLERTKTWLACRKYKRAEQVLALVGKDLQFAAANATPLPFPSGCQPLRSCYDFNPHDTHPPTEPMAR